MRVFLLVVLTMIGFAANSLLTRAGIDRGGLDPLWFGAIRLVSGAVVLVLLVLVSGRRGALRGAWTIWGVVGLFLYILGFSVAYLRLDAGLGALVLFGVVQITMFLGSLMGREAIPPLRWAGAGVAFAGLCWLVWPGGAVQVDPLAAVLMALAGLGWGIYSLVGRGAQDPLAATAAHFLIVALPFALLALVFVPLPPIGPGVGLAMLSGAVTSGLVYALWYALLPRLDGSVAAVAQLSVPLIAIAAGALWLQEPVSARLVFATLLVLGGVALSVLGPGYLARRSIGS
jgi:drug/metabolite transporter (DMT)-like permease